MEAEAVVDMLLQDYPDVKFWVSFQCKVINETKWIGWNGLNLNNILYFRMTKAWLMVNTFLMLLIQYGTK